MNQEIWKDVVWYEWLYQISNLWRVKSLNYKAIEHLTPVSRNLDNHIYNLVYTCKSCNSKKRQNTLEEYAIKQNRIDWINKWEILFTNTM